MVVLKTKTMRPCTKQTHWHQYTFPCFYTLFHCLTASAINLSTSVIGWSAFAVKKREKGNENKKWLFLLSKSSENKRKWRPVIVLVVVHSSRMVTTRQEYTSNCASDVTKSFHCVGENGKTNGQSWWMAISEKVRPFPWSLTEQHTSPLAPSTTAKITVSSNL